MWKNISEWIDAQFKGYSMQELIDQRLRVEDLTGLLSREQALLQDMELSAARIDGALKGINAAEHIQTMKKK